MSQRSTSWVQKPSYLQIRGVNMEDMDAYGQDGAKGELSNPKDWVLCRSLPATPTRIIHHQYMMLLLQEPELA
ncbi:uncharacterized protein EAE98_001860 [Botrytis deweyae]|uniref:Uncharacterized protein n=1 Tax=Botrytis deweyae TaxID=2478750 RepID=A0ABQ7IZ84_9HELO|nr:uncharacterized protein EAE98_001860 [Botrytis deweyae]KAF7937546.1 hypothetical protein EAE98_001860 [Botrytis deweyae]